MPRGKLKTGTSQPNPLTGMVEYVPLSADEARGIIGLINRQRITLAHAMQDIEWYPKDPAAHRSWKNRTQTGHHPYVQNLFRLRKLIEDEEPDAEVKDMTALMREWRAALAMAVDEANLVGSEMQRGLERIEDRQQQAKFHEEQMGLAREKLLGGKQLTMAELLSQLRPKLPAGVTEDEMEPENAERVSEDVP